MKTIFYQPFLIAFLLLSLFACNKPVADPPFPTEPLEDQLRADYTRFGVNMHSYEFFQLEDSPAPFGYLPFYISHYGRHGSRSNWGDQDYCHIIAVLDSAKREGLLTPAGDSLLLKTQQVLAAYNGMNGRLTDRGEREHALLAERMYFRYSQVFSVDHPQIIAIGSLVPRCLVSMAAFTNRLTKLRATVRYDFDSGEQTQKYIDCCGSASDEVRARYHALQDSIMAQIPYDSTIVMQRLFTATPSVMQGQSVRQFQKEIFYTCAIAQDFDIDVNMLDFIDFSTAYYYQMELTHHIALRFANTSSTGSIRVKNAQNALDEFVASADQAIADMQQGVDRPVVANLRFGHDYPLLCIVSLMGIEGPGTPMDPEDIASLWYGHLNICMASNLQLVFYHYGDRDILVKALYNERERRILGLTPVQGPYYKWTDVKAKWTSNR